MVFCYSCYNGLMEDERHILGFTLCWAPCQVLLFGLEYFSTDFPSSYLIALTEHLAQMCEEQRWVIQAC